MTSKIYKKMVQGPLTGLLMSLVWISRHVVLHIEEGAIHPLYVFVGI